MYLSIHVIFLTPEVTLHYSQITKFIGIYQCWLYLSVMIIMSTICSASVKFVFTSAHNFSLVHSTQSQVLLFIHINNRSYNQFSAMSNAGLPTKPIGTRSKTHPPTSPIVLEVDPSVFSSDDRSALLDHVSVCGDYSLLMYLPF